MNENGPYGNSAIYFKYARDGKQLLRGVMQNYMPLSVTKAQKQGFSSPDASWFKGESIDFVKNKLLGKGVRLFEYLDQNEVKFLVNQHLQGKENRRLLIWSLLSLNSWIEENLK